MAVIIFRRIYDTLGSTSIEGIRLAPPLLADRGYITLHRTGEGLQGDRWVHLRR